MKAPKICREVPLSHTGQYYLCKHVGKRPKLEKEPAKERTASRAHTGPRIVHTAPVSAERELYIQ